MIERQEVTDALGAPAQQAAPAGQAGCSVWLMDTITKVAMFNDAGVGKEGAGIAAMAMLQARGCAAVTVAHTSARIGDARDTWEHGVLSHVNAAAQALGLAPGQALRDAMQRLR
jgi:hypothetical protein